MGRPLATAWPSRRPRLPDDRPVGGGGAGRGSSGRPEGRARATQELECFGVVLPVGLTNFVKCCSINPNDANVIVFLHNIIFKDYALQVLCEKTQNIDKFVHFSQFFVNYKFKI